MRMQNNFSNELADYGRLIGRMGNDERLLATHVSLFTGCFGDMLHPIPWQTDHPFCWHRNAADALAA